MFGGDYGDVCCSWFLDMFIKKHPVDIYRVIESSRYHRGTKLLKQLGYDLSWMSIFYP